MGLFIFGLIPRFVKHVNYGTLAQMVPTAHCLVGESVDCGLGVKKYARSDLSFSATRL